MAHYIAIALYYEMPDNNSVVAPATKSQTAKYTTVVERAFIPCFKCFIKVYQHGRIASEESVLLLIKGKCLPILLYGLETCPLKKMILDHSTLSSIVYS